ncbi:glycosyltransferase family 9 protein [Vibrio sp. S11_S32]|uniref:glycosyltransferase family 9 protein n=1 Tax=Vibrio sp. S11_S32 TaxID=2720225 RepID=UPI00168199A1|nr:glycosyltransferase family 9 protein [Vibrio sp. S11_S32]MBD1576845.1 glycosyltransferase family 9 protein [Vibrio sp. S11_S32]
MALFTTAPNSICILRLSAIGDVCNTIAAVQCIQRQWPTTKITWITGKLEAQLIHDLPKVDVVVFDKKEGIKGYFSLWKKLKDQKFDALLHMQYALRASVATLGIKAKYKLGFDAKRSQDFQTWFTNVKVPSPEAPHVLDGLLAFTSTLGITDITPTWSIPYSEDDNRWVLQHLSNQNNASKNLIIVPAASKAYKNWTVEGYVAVIQHAQKLGWHVFLAGSPAQIELDLAQRIQRQVTNVTNLVGKSSIKQILALIDLADLVIAPDTGPTHMANAMNTPVIGLYAHHNPERTGPYQYRKYIVSAYKEAIAKEHTLPIEQLPWRTRVKDPRAMNLISPESVIAMFEIVRSDFDL